MSKKKITAPLELVPYIENMLEELEKSKFHAHQVPDTKKGAIAGRNIWVAISWNPDWYSELLRRYPKKAKKKQKKVWRRVQQYRSKVTRIDIVRVLEKMLNGGTRSKYANDLLAIAEVKRDEEEKPLDNSYAEWYFSRYHNIPLTQEEVNQVEMYPESTWSDCANFYKKNGALPDCLYPNWSDNEDVPF